MSVLTNQVGLSISEDKIQLVEIIDKNNTFYLENVDEEYFEESLFEDTKEAKFIHILQNAFNELILRKSLSTSKISVTLPQSYFKIFEIPVDKNLTKNDLNVYIKWELSKLFPNESKDHFTFQKIVLNSLNYEATKRVLVYATSINVLKRIHKFCVRNNLLLINIDSAHTASAGFLSEDPSLLKLSVYIENNHLSILTFSNNNVIFEKSINYKTVQEIPEIISSIIEEMNTRELITQSIDKIFVFGNSVTSELINHIENSTKITPAEIQPFSKLIINPVLKENKLITDYAQKFSAAAAIVLRIGS